MEPGPHIPSAPALPLTDIRNPAPAPQQPRPPQLPALTSVRFFAALYVALFHMVRPFSRWGPLAGFMGSGFTGVSFFFLLSGFILTYSHAAEPDTGPAFRRRFLFARLARIYPVYFVTTVLAGILLRAEFSSKGYHVVAFIADFLMLQTWSIRMTSFFNTVAWSVSMEFFFYLVFPFVFLRLAPRSRAAAVGGFLGFWALAMLFPLISLHLYPGGWTGEVPNHFNRYIHRLPPIALPEFLAGIMLGWLYLRFPPSRRNTAVLAWMGLLLILPVLYLSGHLPEIMLHNGLLLPLEALLILGLTKPNALSRLLSIKPLVLLGEASYAFYLLHFMLGNRMDDYSWTGQTIRSLPAKLAVSISLALALYLLLERPARRAMLQWWNRRHAVA